MKAVLFIHGLSAQKEDNEYFINKMSQYSNIQLFAFTLPGHENNKMTKVKYEDWLNKAEEELKQILKKHKKVQIVAHSMGTIIAVYLASKYPQIESLVLLSSAFVFGNFEQNKKDFYRLIQRKVDQNLGTGFEGALTKFFRVPKSVMIEYLKMAQKIKPCISKITCPVLLIHGMEDNVISYKSSEFVYHQLNCKKDILLVKNVRHQVFKSLKKEEITNYIYRYISSKMLYSITRKSVI